MSQILPNLFLGSLKVAQDSKALKERKIKHVLSCGEFQFPDNYKKLVRRRKELPIKDNHIQPIMFFFWEAHEFISGAISINENVLVHCLKGMSRSASIVISYVLISSHKGSHPDTLPEPLSVQ
jgi:protein-tyrosine phosphatase